MIPAEHRDAAHGGRELSRVAAAFGASVERFAAWLETSGYATYDPYDLWGTRYGKWARRLFYRKHPLGLVLTAPLIVGEIVCPGMRAWFVEKDRFPTADGQLVLAFLNLHKLAEAGVEGNREPGSRWLSKARGLAEDLLTCSIPGYSGHCWGYPFDWENVNGLMPKGTPHVTATPYCYEAFAGLLDATGERRYSEIARSAASFIFNDLTDTPTGENAAASSYSPEDCGKVVNASAYRAFVLFDAAQRFGDERFEAKAWKNLNFMLQSQRDDGAWLYAIDNPKESFIDHFHTCFVLKNLWKINRHLRNHAVTRAVRDGYRYYRSALFDADDNPRSFALAPRRQIVRLEMYNMAEAISLGCLLRDEIPEAFDLAVELGRRLVGQYQVRAGYFVTRVYTGGIRHTLPFMRWPQAQLFYAMTNLVTSLKGVGTRDGAAREVSLSHR